MPFTLTPAHQISYQMYAGPGADSMRAASQQLRELAFSADTTAESLNDTLYDLDDTWKGSSSDLLADAVERYLQWLSKHSSQLKHAAWVINGLANAYNDTRRKVVPPAAIANNREEVRRLIASDITGENAPAIAELDEQYQSYGDTNVQAMNLYAERAQTLLSDLPRWREPPQIYQRGRGG
ncbi:PPE family protein PPE57 [Mycobacterium tuberculosis TB_RSA103]|uniref:PPE family protein n=1 Tax=Mycobacterium tuberculosis TaxID=1773 RepID=UPI00045980E3|nr:PPE family protein [Mycobacterium tuberculosis]KCJ00669.1 PPE family protein PPE57 [Mycobacterium tuberculosis TB_RSA103]